MNLTPANGPNICACGAPDPAYDHLSNPRKCIWILNQRLKKLEELCPSPKPT